jgi:hypothetical protein|tara:strand:+ start:120 stop:1193 length:1074 start_codon:yes stop_codon:yes gene_type:complete
MNKIVTRKLVSSETKFNKISGILSTLEINKIYSIQDIIILIGQISNLKSDTLKNIPEAIKQSGTNLIPLSELYVDMTYQRVLRLQTIINKIQHGGFDIEAAGFIDVAVRPGGIKTVWDGFRRCIMAGICGYNHINGSKTIHDPYASDKECQKKEARLFQRRNTQEKMKPEEVFKSEVVYEDSVALKTLQFIKDCELDVAGLNLDGKPLGGLTELRNNYKSWNKNFDDEDIDPDSDGGYDWDENKWIESSKIIQTVWNKPTDAVVSVYLLRDLAWLKTIMSFCDKEYLDEDIIEALKEWKKSKNKRNQKDITSAGFKNKRITSLFIAKHILKDNNGLTKKLTSHLSDDQKVLLSATEM